MLILCLSYFITTYCTYSIFSGEAPTYSNCFYKCMNAMNSAKMKSLQNYKTMEEQLKTCLPLEVFLAQELVSQKSLMKFTPIVLTGLFSGGRSSETLAFATASLFRLV